MEDYHDKDDVSPEQKACLGKRPDEPKQECLDCAVENRCEFLTAGVESEYLGHFDESATGCISCAKRDECQESKQKRLESEQASDVDGNTDIPTVGVTESDSKPEDGPIQPEADNPDNERTGNDEQDSINGSEDAVRWFSSLKRIPTPTKNDPDKILEFNDVLKEKLLELIQDTASSERVAMQDEREMILERGCRFAAMHTIIKNYKAEAKDKFSVKTVVDFIAKKVFNRRIVTLYKALKLWNKFGKRASSLTNLTAEKLSELARLKDSTREAWLADPEIMGLLEDLDHKTVADMVRKQKANDDAKDGTAQKKPRGAVRNAANGRYVLKSSTKNTVVNGLGKMAVEQLDILTDVMDLIDGHAPEIKESLRKIRVQSTETKRTQEEEVLPESEDSINAGQAA